MELLRPTQLGANDSEDMVIITLGDLHPRVAWQTAIEVCHSLRMACKAAARHDRAPANFWREMDLEDLNDCPKTHRGFRRSRQAPNVSNWQVSYLGAEVQLIFDDRGQIMGYEDGIRVHQMIRRAARRAKAWSGESRLGRTLVANLTDAEEDYRLGLS